MKSVIITFVIFIALFGLLKLDISSVFSGYWLPLISLVTLIATFAVAIFLFGLPTKDNFKKALNIKQKEVEDEKDN